MVAQVTLCQVSHLSSRGFRDLFAALGTRSFSAFPGKRNNPIDKSNARFLGKRSREIANLYNSLWLPWQISSHISYAIVHKRMLSNNEDVVCSQIYLETVPEPINP